MRLKTIEKKIADFGFTKTQETLDFIRYERKEELKDRTHMVTLEHPDNCIYHIYSYYIHQCNNGLEPAPLIYGLNDLFNKRLKVMIKANLKRGRY